MEITGKVIQVLPVQKFNGRNGEIVKNSFVVETNEQYPKKVCVTCIGDERWQKLGIVVGKNYNLGIDVSSREWKGRWFTEVNCWRAVNLDGNNANAGTQQMPQSPVPNAQPYSAPSQPQDNSGNDPLPF